MGTFIRTSEFLGAPAIVAVGNCVDFFEPKVVRATAGAIFHLPLCRASEEDFLHWAHQAGLSLIAAVAEGALSVKELPPDIAPAAVLFGSEAHGLPKQAIAAARLCVTIPRRGKTESLNVSVAAGIILWAITSKLYG